VWAGRVRDGCKHAYPASMILLFRCCPSHQAHWLTMPSLRFRNRFLPAMAAPEPPLPPCRALSDPAPSSSNATTPVASSSKAPVTGFRSSLEHTGIPRSVLLWKPRLPSRNWTIFLTVAGTVSYLYYDDRRQCRRIKAATIERVKHLSQEPMPGSLDLPRKIIAIGARWPEDDDDGRALRYFRKYVKVSLKGFVCS
jgi:import inner membrane translocase subunit TIM54